MKKTTKTLICVIAAVLVVLAIVIIAAKISAAKPTKTIDNFAKEIKKSNFEKASQYTADDTFDLFGIDEKSDDLDMVKYYYKNLNIKVNKVTKAKDSAIVNIEVSNKDLGKVLSLYMIKAQELALQRVTSSSANESMEKELEEYFKSLFEGEMVQTISNTIDIVLVKQDGKWKIVVDNNLRDVMLPGLYSATDLFVA